MMYIHTEYDANDDNDDEHPPTKQLKIATPLVDQEDEDAQEQKQYDHTRTTAPPLLFLQL